MPTTSKELQHRKRYANQSGHILLYMPEHPNATRSGMIAEHVVVAASALGKPLPPRAQVHHVNRDPSDNRPANLVVCEDSAYHHLLHARLRAVKACGKPDWRPCRVCGVHDDPATMKTESASGKRRTPTFAHPECLRRQWKKYRKPFLGKLVDLTCAECGSVFHRHARRVPRGAQRGRRVFCSRRCSSVAGNRERQN